MVRHQQSGYMSRCKGDLRIAGSNQSCTMVKKRFQILGYLLYIPAMILFVSDDFNMLLVAFFFYGLGNMLQLNSFQVLIET
jgi:hypothetical protein